MIHLMIFLPVLGSLLLMATPRRWREEVAGFIAALTLGLGLLIWRAGGTELFSIPWIDALGVTYSVQLDGVSLALALVTAFMSFIACLYTARRIPNPGTMLALILGMETGLLGIFAARDLILFYVFFEDALIPALLMLAIYGKDRRMKALVKFAAYTLFGSLLMLVSFIGIKYLGGSPTFALADLRANPVQGAMQTWLYIGFLLAMAVKLPLWPLHAWLPDFHEQNHESGIPDVMGTLYKVGGYGIFQFGITLFPDASLELRPILMGLAAFTALYAAWIAFHQTDWKRLLAYAGLSHMGFVALGVFSLNETAVIGAMYLLAFQNLYTGALFLSVGMLQERIGSLDTRVGGVMTQAGALGGLTMALWFASIAVPGMAGFIGEFSILLGAYQISPWLTFIAGITTIAAAAYALTAFQTTFWQARPLGGVRVADLQHVEWLVLGLPLAVAIFFGIYSAPALNLMQPAVKAVLSALGGQ
ncbi:NADH-quinone oxidoreductase subunit M [Deinococcus deserti]|uniref:Putative NADH dehydrogenase (Quinone), subunit M (NADH-quinone oxidoreductase, subunit M) n=1 Tax=Deinococcus deserti (strain DSM 17065 / CIP 109153 / LMG 22923 / VCD115) TaxID=546414 RepID=C1D0I3_DEIDV|nr:NADH-quinone oxidoreductase subunit M [Deinococcus deserti]ACO45357.1 putative NADH dehydrogenase (quinone), subunit M (NADH-quinone oxidoreductase, subunit M) [Deinococcus deserti VCD115]